MATVLHFDFIEIQVLPGTGVEQRRLLGRLRRHRARARAEEQAALLAERDRLQAEIDAWHRAYPGPIGGARHAACYREFLQRIGYLQCRANGIEDQRRRNVDAELALQAGPQLVVPITNARYALNAANARWGSLYDALYGTDALPETGGCERGPGYNPVRGVQASSTYTRATCSTRPHR